MFSTLVGSNSLGPHRPQPARILSPWDSPGKNTKVGCYFLLQGIFLTQGLNPGLLHLLPWQTDSLPLSHRGSSFKKSREHIAFSSRAFLPQGRVLPFP